MVADDRVSAAGQPGSNCVRGGFVCAGYPPQRGTWPKPESKPAQVNIESKDPNYVPPGAYGMPQQQPPYNNQPLVGQQLKRDHPLPYNRGQPSLRITPPQGRPLQSDDDRPTASTLPSASVLSPDNKLSALSGYTTSASVNVFPTPVSAASGTVFDRTPKEYQRVPPLHDLTRTEPDHQQPQSAVSHPPSTTLPQPPFSVLHTSRNNTPPKEPGTFGGGDSDVGIGRVVESPACGVASLPLEDKLLVEGVIWPSVEHLLLLTTRRRGELRV